MCETNHVEQLSTCSSSFSQHSIGQDNNNSATAYNGEFSHQPQEGDALAGSNRVSYRMVDVEQVAASAYTSYYSPACNCCGASRACDCRRQRERSQHFNHPFHAQQAVDVQEDLNPSSSQQQQQQTLISSGHFLQGKQFYTVAEWNEYGKSDERQSAGAQQQRQSNNDSEFQSQRANYYEMSKVDMQTSNTDQSRQQPNTSQFCRANESNQDFCCDFNNNGTTASGDAASQFDSSHGQQIHQFAPQIQLETDCNNSTLCFQDRNDSFAALQDLHDCKPFDPKNLLPENGSHKEYLEPNQRLQHQLAPQATISMPPSTSSSTRAASVPSSLCSPQVSHLPTTTGVFVTQNAPRNPTSLPTSRKVSFDNGYKFSTTPNLSQDCSQSGEQIWIATQDEELSSSLSGAICNIDQYSYDTSENQSSSLQCSSNETSSTIQCSSYSAPECGTMMMMVVGNSSRTCSQLDQSDKCLNKPPRSKQGRRGRPRKKSLKSKGKVNGKLWEFIRDLLLSEQTNPSFIRWERREDGTFKFVQSDKVAKMWGERKHNPKMTYEKLSRAMRYYYKSRVLLPVFGRRLVYKFGPNATGWMPPKSTTMTS